MLQASQVFGAPAYLARALGCAPHDVYQWIAGAEFPTPAQCQHLETLLEDVLAQRGARQSQYRRWSDRDREPAAA
jgi:hypothetical protein